MRRRSDVVAGAWTAVPGQGERRARRFPRLLQRVPLPPGEAARTNRWSCWETPASAPRTNRQARQSAENRGLLCPPPDDRRSSPLLITGVRASPPRRAQPGGDPPCARGKWWTSPQLEAVTTTPHAPCAVFPGTRRACLVSGRGSGMPEEGRQNATRQWALACAEKHQRDERHGRAMVDNELTKL